MQLTSLFARLVTSTKPPCVQPSFPPELKALDSFRDRNGELPNGFAVAIKGKGYIINGESRFADGSITVFASKDSVLFTITPAKSNGVIGRDLRLEFTSQGLNRDLEAGRYKNAERAPFASAGHPGIEVSADSRGANSEDGEFSIREIKFNAAGKLEKLALAFRVKEDGSSDIEGVLLFERPKGAKEDQDQFTYQGNFNKFCNCY